MGQKTHPDGIRLLFNGKEWDSRWYTRSKKDFRNYIAEDYRIREYIKKKLRHAAVPKISIERAGNRMRCKVYTARPGLVIGRKGEALDRLREEVQKLTKNEVILDIVEVKKPDLVGHVVAEVIALQLERRVSFRRAMKKAVQTAMSLGAQGIQVICSGRLGGADIARSECQKAGKIPRHTFREPLDYGCAEARTLYGIVGVKCWVLGPEEKENRL